ncbi:cysteine-rich receptor-like protein kinase 10 [Tasmannia lanceolata]|uniref:cysteine-rich receptor-like protein kinase 10 n=1 Tax=Tasmannia lanceolata TaxID=3420 RepID=UPI004062F25E
MVSFDYAFPEVCKVESTLCPKTFPLSPFPFFAFRTSIDMMHLFVSKPIDFLPLILLLILLESPIKAEDQILTQCGSPNSNYSSGSQFERNLNTLLPSLAYGGVQNISSFYYTTSGNDPNRVYGFAQCMSAASADVCRECLTNATVQNLQRCPNRTQVAVRYYNCILRYSDQPFLSQLTSGPLMVTFCAQLKASNPDLFNERLGILLRTISSRASSDPSKFATDVTRLGNFENIFGMGQCTRDLSQRDCDSCLETMIGFIPGSSCSNVTVGGIYSVSCNIKYDPSRFFEASPPPPVTVAVPPPSPPLPFPPPQEPPTNRNKSRIVLIIVTVVVSTLVLISIIWAWLWKRKQVKRASNFEDQVQLPRSKSLLFDLATLRAATDDFSDANKLGEGGFGPVYKGKLIDGEEIAVKRLSRRSTQGIEELKNEILTVAKLQHKNLVRLLGFCLEEQEKILVYEYLPNTSLDAFLFDPAKRVQLDWERRYKIIEGIARGLLYLHEDSRLRIIHRDLKASNILMDGDMNAKITDFGLAKLFGEDQTHGITNHIAGTYGYMPPEYAYHGQFSTRSDVFSFGVLVLEIITGRQNAGFLESDGATNLLSYTWKHWTEGSVLDVVDRTLGEQRRRDKVFRCIHMGLLCVQEDAAERPTMSSVVLMLNSNSISLPTPLTPAFCDQSRTRSDVLSNLTASESYQSGLVTRSRRDRRY